MHLVYIYIYIYNKNYFFLDRNTENEDDEILMSLRYSPKF